MDTDIKILDDAIIAQIAAGEAVSRPAAVIKELMENALDARASKIEVIFSDAGKSSIIVTDNGLGMSEQDLKMSIVRHATSKIQTVADLQEALTMGFRGEALASICAVADLTVLSGRARTGTQMNVVNGDVTVRPAPFVQGTQVKISGLFRRVPARLKFLKHNRAEILAILNVVKAVALSRPDVDISLREMNDKRQKTLVSYRPETRDDRIKSVMGSGFHTTSIDLFSESESVCVEGRISSPRGFRKTQGDSFIFVNNRPVRSTDVVKALRSGLSHHLNADKHPEYCVFITVPPRSVDVNAHPAKTEVRFRDFDSIAQNFHHALTQAFPAHPCVKVNDDLPDNAQSIQRTQEGLTLGDWVLFRKDGVLLAACIRDVVREHAMAAGKIQLDPPLTLCSSAVPVSCFSDLSRLGVDADVFGPGAIIIRSVPKSVLADPQKLVVNIKTARTPAEGVISWITQSMDVNDVIALAERKATPVSEQDLITAIKRMV